MADPGTKIPSLRMEDFPEELLSIESDWIKRKEPSQHLYGPVQSQPNRKKAILVRIGIDHAYGSWNAPIDPRTGQFLYVPIPDGATKEYSSNNPRRFRDLDLALEKFSNRLGVANLKLPPQLRSLVMHLDPDFEHLTYGDNGKRRGAGIAKLTGGDLLVFYSGLRSIAAPHQLIYGLVGLYVVDDVIPATLIPAEECFKNAHTRWKTISDNDVVVRGKPGASGRLERCIPIGEWRERAYRIREDLEKAWGGLSVKNGYIQRSAVPPSFVDPEKFYEWFKKQGVGLIQRNN